MFKLPHLPYDYKALEPHIDEQTMRIHHTQHHAAYINNLNKALEGYSDWLSKPVEEIIANLGKVPNKVRTAVRNNGGGHANHTMYWQIMSPDGGGKPQAGEKLAKAINSAFGDFDSFKKIFETAGMTRFGSGWAWLVVDNPSTVSGQAKLLVTSTANQDSPLTDGKTPILGCDVWEHAYYLKYQNRRADYLSAWWNVVNWQEVSTRFSKAL
ncbi:MAG: superoxide dismutase [Candidatus Paceibacterota bacterium]